MVTSPVELARAASAAVKAPRDAASTVLAGLGAGRRAVKGGSASTLNGPIGPSRRYTWTSYSLDDVKRVRRALGGTLNDIVVATATRGFRDLLLGRGEDVEDRTVRVIIPSRPARARREGHRGGVRPLREPDHGGLRRPAGRASPTRWSARA